MRAVSPTLGVVVLATMLIDVASTRTSTTQR